MSKVLLSHKEVSETTSFFPTPQFLINKRNPTKEEISLLEVNRNFSSDPEWKNLYVSSSFDASLIRNSEFKGLVVLGDLEKKALKYHDLILDTGIYNSLISNCVIGDNFAIRDVHYLENYELGQRVMLFNIQEMSCTNHSKFGNGVLKEGEPESNRIWIEVANENGGRAILPFQGMLPSDAYIWSRQREDTELMKGFLDLTEALYDPAEKTHGYVGNDVVIKNTSLIKDARIEDCAYIKGAFKLKNITVCSTEDEPSQIGEGVEMVNGIMGAGCKVFYQAVAVRFLLGRNCQLKYGARLLNSVLGDNSTVSCCELLNNLIFPFHEQHHNTSFLIATTIQGQSNIAAGSTIGSNHNSRSPDGEIFAGRGFWPGLCSDFKHNSKFASFSLILKSSYPYELNITYPFCLVATEGAEQPINIMPAYWFMYNMFAVARNNSKFKKRDKRVIKEQHIETDPLAPDTMQEILLSLDRIITLTARWLKTNDPWFANKSDNLYQMAKDYLHQNPDTDIVLKDDQCMKKYGALIIKPAKGYKEYRKMVKYFAVRTLFDYAKEQGIESLTKEHLNKIEEFPLYTMWQNVGGQIIPDEKLNELYHGIKTKKITSWNEVHQFYDQCQEQYLQFKTRYALYLLEQLYSAPISTFTSVIYSDILSDVLIVSNYMYETSISSRQKDYTDFFRTTTFRTKEEMTAVIGRLEDNDFLQQLEKETESLNKGLETLFKNLG